MKKNNIMTFKKNELLIDTIKKINSQIKKNSFIKQIIKNNSCSSTETDIVKIRKNHYLSSLSDCSISSDKHCDCCGTSISSNSSSISSDKHCDCCGISISSNSSSSSSCQ